ncbi:MAG: primosomal protein N' [candidate division Zixibacteria bacterium]|nr:primosomal protein N' [candidate division Zixibacteria bacterium]
MAASVRFAEIALPLPVDQVFSYSIPDKLLETALPGSRVSVAFTNRRMTGVITGLSDTCPVERYKPLLDILDREPVLDATLLELTRWIGRYYLCPWGEAIKAALPAGLLSEGDQIVTRDGPCPPECMDRLRRTAPRQAELLAQVPEQGAITLSSLRRRTRMRQPFAVLRSLEAKGLVSISIGDSGGGPGIRYETWVELIPSREDAEKIISRLIPRSPRQASCVNLLARHDGRLTTEQLRHLGRIERAVVRRLEKKGLVSLSEVETIRDPYRDAELPDPGAVDPTDEQADALRAIHGAIGEGAFKSLLLYGVTGSGKTHVYVKSIEKTLESGRSAIVLVPELALTPQAVRQFRAHFGDLVTVLHSGLSPGERYDSWRRTRAGDYRIVVGARSAVFAPLSDLGLIVIDEEHEPSYKQFDDPPLYHARDVAVVRARMANAVTVMGSATPSLETYANTQNGKFACCRLTRRVDRRPLPGVRIVDMREERRLGRLSIFSAPLADRIRDRLARKEQIILFLNRRGFSPFVQCYDCGLSVSCPHCSVTMTYHADSLFMRCHYCDHREQAPEACPKCRSDSIGYRGVGTQRVEEELKERFPDARIVRMDMDTTTRKGSHQDIFHQVLNHEADILLGTQMVAKGFDFPNVTLVGVISADTSLNLPDFRASERTFQLLTQVAGRTGRGKLGGEVIVQTYSRGHHSVTSAQAHDYESFYGREITDRQALGYPPYGRMVGVLFQGEQDEYVMREARRFAEIMRKYAAELNILGPAPPVIARVRNLYRWQIIARSSHSARLRDTVRRARLHWERAADSRRIHLKIDVDPVGLM